MPRGRPGRTFPSPSRLSRQPDEPRSSFATWTTSDHGWSASSKLAGLPAGELRTSRLPSGWTPIELLKHLTYVEMRWLEWGFEGADVADPWGDQPGDRWDGADPATLERVLFHLVQEYARHVGHLDVVSELAGGVTGE